ncbi:MAG: class I SAM-dependent methyltransferase [Actinomycetota bacterium]|nr:class I SAM-dependent methyltransferase [Actinomycetota bacterium]
MHVQHTIGERQYGTDDQYVCLERAVDEALGPLGRVLDVGAGGGDNVYVSDLRERGAELVGVDPDPAIGANPFLDDALVGRIEDHADELAGGFDLVVAVYVLEHVETPIEFFEAVARCLTPTGTFLALTPNLTHYFGLAAMITNRLAVDEVLLRRLRGPVVEEYHFPTRYRANSTRAIVAAADRARFASTDITHLDDEGVFRPYLPGRLARFSELYSRTVHHFELARAMGTLLVSCRR